MDPLDLVQSTAEAAFASGKGNRITMWNKAAERLLGYKAEEVVGRSCYDVLCGLDLFGNRFCDEKCNLRKMASRRESIRQFQMDVRKASGQILRVAVSVLSAPGSSSSQPTIIHLLQPVGEAKERSQDGPLAPAAPGASPPAAQPPLTRREIEVLRHLAAGASTREIAGSMFISVATARTHIQNILRKLEVHSKLAAVSAAVRKRLL
jgi:PAS domain S-box-containing protein